MNSSFNYEILEMIFDYMTFNEIIKLRLVSKLFKTYIDEYLSKQTLLSLFDEKDLYFIIDMTLSMNLDLNEIVKNRIKVSGKELSSTKLTNSMVRMFPNIRQFYFPCDNEARYHSCKPNITLDYEILSSSWKNIEKLLIQDITKNNYKSIIKFLNSLKSLETLIIFENFINPSTEEPYLHIHGNEEFLKRLKHVNLPCSSWLKFFQRYSIQSCGFNSYRGYDTKSLQSYGFNKLKSLRLELNFSSESFISLYLLKLYEIRNTITQLEFFNYEEIILYNHYSYHENCLTADMDTEKPIWPNFFNRLNEFESLEIVKFSMANSEFLEALLDYSRNFQYIKEIQIIYKLSYGEGSKFKKCTFIPDGILQFLPIAMKSVKKITIFPMDKAAYIKLKKIDTSRYDYDLDIHNCILENWS